MQRFRKDYPNAEVIVMEQNYRSTQIVLDTARAVIDRNPHRTPKALFTERKGGEKVIVYEAYDDEYEAKYVADQIDYLRNQRYHYHDIAVMYRTNTQSRALEDILRRRAIPYTLVGGVGFYKRREVKDLLAYLHVIQNPDDRMNFDRIINTPKRGIGVKAQQEFEAVKTQKNLTTLELFEALLRGEPLPLATRTAKLFAEFGQKLLQWRDLIITGQLVNLFDAIMSDIGYNLYIYQNSETPEETEERTGNLKELRGLLVQADEEQIPLSEWMADQTLMTDADDPSETQDKVTLLTLHAAKGLEFPVVFITGLEEGLLPHIRSREEPDGLEEERRLFYVGLTRAKERLFLTYAFRRTSWGGSEMRIVSKFLEDIPTHLASGLPDKVSTGRQSRSYEAQTTWSSTPRQENPELNRLKRDLAAFKGNLNAPAQPNTPPATPASSTMRSKILPFPGGKDTSDTEETPTAPDLGYRTGQKVRHAKFGTGIITSLSRDGEMVSVKFDAFGVKHLLTEAANLTIL
ncbi:ATP-binding domain-containing protein [bacterium]|nr:ATP-binding domain-containing protein [bacterium]